MELLITVAIVGVLATIAYPSYVEHVARSNRSEGQAELLRFANLQEQLFVDTRRYAGTMSALGASGDTFLTESRHYVISVRTTANGFRLTATAQGNQANTDTGCTVLSLTEAGVKAPSQCW